MLASVDYDLVGDAQLRLENITINSQLVFNIWV